VAAVAHSYQPSGDAVTTTVYNGAPADPHRQEFSPTFDLPSAAARSTVGCGLWVYHASELAGVTFRILCEVRSAGGRSWNYLFEHTVEDPAGPHVY
jgi:hypothetical protein